MVQPRGSDVGIAAALVSTPVGAVVLGMGRSGTSAVARTLAASGFYAGSDSELMEATSANPVGFWENMALVRVDEEILERIGGTWFMPPTSQAQLAAAGSALPKLRTVVARLIAEAGSAPLVIKDPRIGVMLKLWGPLIDETLHPVLVVRNPAEIALSLATRDGTPTAFALASWSLHMAGLLEYLHGRPVTVAPYAQLLRSPEAVTMFVRAVAAQLAADRVGCVDPGAAPQAIESALYRSRAELPDLAEHLTGRQAELWGFLDALPPGNQVLNVPPELTRPNRAAEALTRCENDRVHHLRYLEELQAQVAAHRSRADSAEGTRALAEQARAVAEQARAVAEQTRAQAEQTRAQAEYWLRAIQDSASWRLTAPLRSILRLFRRVRAALLGSARASTSSTSADR